MAKGHGDEEVAIERILRFVGSGEIELRAEAGEDRVTLESARDAIEVSRHHLAACARRGLLARKGERLRATARARAVLARSPAAGDAFADRHPEPAFVPCADGEARMVNLSESPLGQLARRKGRDGQGLVTAEEVAAGERLRADYERALIMPRLGIDWEAPIASGRKGGRRDGQRELSDGAMAARSRVEKALEAVGPELSGVLVDICCFLKGLERVERERGWPARSAKLLLKAALGVLARHYAPQGGERPRRILHWGTNDYRPRVAEAS